MYSKEKNVQQFQQKHPYDEEVISLEYSHLKRFQGRSSKPYSK